MIACVRRVCTVGFAGMVTQRRMTGFSCGWELHEAERVVEGYRCRMPCIISHQYLIGTQTYINGYDVQSHDQL